MDKEHISILHNRDGSVFQKSDDPQAVLSYAFDLGSGPPIPFWNSPFPKCFPDLKMKFPFNFDGWHRSSLSLKDRFYCSVFNFRYVNQLGCSPCSQLSLLTNYDTNETRIMFVDMNKSKIMLADGTVLELLGVFWDPS